MSETKGKNPDELGALWIKTGAKGDYMTGTINGVAVVCFYNERKQGNQPDWRVLKSKPKVEKRESAPARDDFNADPLGFD